MTAIAYILAQFSGTNAITNYLPTIFGLIGVKGTGAKIWLYGVAKLVCCVAASLVFVDVLGRRISLLTGITIQTIYHTYLSGYLKSYTTHLKSISKGASQAAIAVVYIYALA